MTAPLCRQSSHVSWGSPEVLTSTDKHFVVPFHDVATPSMILLLRPAGRDSFSVDFKADNFSMIYSERVLTIGDFLSGMAVFVWE